MNRKLTISGSGRLANAGSASLSNDWLVLMLCQEDIEAAYREMAADDARERDATEWSEGVISDSLTDHHASR